MEITLALGGGGIKGIAHVGVIRALIKHGFNIKAIAGTSIGGLVAGLIGSGLTPDNIEAHLTEIDQVTFWKRQPDDGPSLMGLAGVTQGISDALGDLTFNELEIPVAMTAVDIQTGELLALKSGLLVEAILAAIAFPGIFPPRKWHGRTLIDGTVLDPVPVGLAHLLKPGNPVAAVILSPLSKDWGKTPTPRLLSSLPNLTKYISKIRFIQALNIYMRSVDIAGTELTELRLQMHQPDVMIRPQTHHIGQVDRIDIREVTRLGEEAAEKMIPEIKKACRIDNRVRRQLRQLVNPETMPYHVT
jgi:NTE family protein